MSYVGETLNQCGLLNLDFSVTAVVAVSGDGPNVCGHLLFYVGNNGSGLYFHVAGGYQPPRYMTSEGYRRYLREGGKVELRRRGISLPKPEGARLYLEKALSEKWLWAVLPHNCVAFVEEIIKAGGGGWSSMTNCPAIAVDDDASTQIRQFFIQLDNEIHRIYGVPR